ncbi:LPXTG cell wall anchor domain-containing protein [Enterococcus casseliflavus]|uniref:LPXTG cell wall anchor domain-containing protein n=1 Tax=Enterococcus casseliflavus TaxID=37734 RepID=UPI0035DDCC49
MKKVIMIGLLVLTFSPLLVQADETTSGSVNEADTFSETISSERGDDSSQTQESVQTSAESQQEMIQTSSSQEVVGNVQGEATDPDEVIASIQEKTGIKDNSDIEILSEDSSTLRGSLSRGITDGSVTSFTQAQLDRLTDEELDNGNRLAMRYADDTMGFDIGYLARIIGALFVDKILSWEAIEPQLSFNANSYASFADLIPVVDQLQEYFRVVYPPNGVFLSLDQTVSNEWMISILTNLNEAEKEIKVDPDAYTPGRIAWIIHAVNQSLYLPDGAESSDSEETTQATEKQETATTTSSKEANATADGEKTLPKTNEAPSYTLLIAGVILLLIVFLILWRRKKK